MKTPTTKTLIYDNACPLCTWAAGKMMQAGLVAEQNCCALQQFEAENGGVLNIAFARNEIPVMDTKTGEVFYGPEGLTLIFAAKYPVLAPVITKKRFKQLCRPFYHFISYNRRIIAGSILRGENALQFAPDFNWRWRTALIALGFGYTAFCVYSFALLTSLSPVLLLACVTGYFLLLLITNIAGNKTLQKQYDYLGHLAVLGLVEGTVFITTALLAKATGLAGLMFAGQGAGRLIAIQMHIKRVENSGYTRALNYAFAFGAVALVVIIAVLKGCSN